MVGDDLEYEEGAEVVYAKVVDPGVGGGEHAGLRPFLQGQGPSRPNIRAVDVGPDDLYGRYTRGLSLQDGLLSDGEKAAETRLREVVLPTPGRGYAGGGD